MRSLSIVLLLGLIAFSQQGVWDNIGYEDVKNDDGSAIADAGDSHTGYVTFNPPFKQAPRVLINLQEISQDQGSTSGFEVTVVNVEANGFTYEITNHGTGSLNRIRLQWFATLQSNIQFFYFRSEQSEVDMNELKLFWPDDLELPYEDIIGQIFLLGYQFTEVNDPFVVLQIKKIDPYGVNVYVGDRKGADFAGDFVSFVIVASNDEYFDPLRAGRNEGTSIPATLNVGAGEREQPISLNIGDAKYLASADRIFLQGISGIQYDDATSVRLSIRNPYSSDDSFTGKLVATQDSILFQAWISIFYYQKIVDCAILYSECGFEGNELEVCEDSPITEFELHDWEGVDIKSVKVPFSRTLTLFDKKNLQGGYTQITEDVECFEGGWTFT